MSCLRLVNIAEGSVLHSSVTSLTSFPASTTACRLQRGTRLRAGGPSSSENMLRSPACFWTSASRKNAQFGSEPAGTTVQWGALTTQYSLYMVALFVVSWQNDEHVM